MSQSEAISDLRRTKFSPQKRRRREYRQIRRAAFTRPEPGFSMYEGRTRGKRMRYTYDDDDAFDSDATSTRRSTRQSNRSTPFDSGPTVTASGRQVRQPRTGEYGESLLSGPPMNTDDLGPEYSEDGRPSSRARSGTEDSEQPVRGGRPTRAAARPVANGFDGSRKRKHIDSYNSIDEMSDEDEADVSNGGWDTDKNEAEYDERMPDADDEDDDMGDADEEFESEDEEQRSLVVKLRVSPDRLANIKTERASLENGLKTEGGFAQAGGPECEPKEEKGANGYIQSTERDEKPQKPEPLSSPTGPSAYPTPTSSSFIPADQKPTMAPLPNLYAPTQRLPEDQTGGGSVGQINGSISHVVPKMEDTANNL